MPTTLSAERPTPDYGCSQSELYAGLDITWNSQAQREADFIAENTNYTAGLSVTRKAAITAARNMPDGNMRYAESRIIRIDLEKKWGLGMAKWNSLSGYIENAWEREYVPTRLSEAGKAFYKDAGEKDWEKVRDMLKDGKIFIDTHEAKLLADGGMPATFKAAYATAKTEFEAKYEEFMTAREDAQEQTDAKVLANNAIYADGVAMMKDGKRIFKMEASVRERFTWERILEMVTPSGSNSAVWEVEVPTGTIKEFNTNDLNLNANTMVKVEVSGNGVQLSTTPTSGPITGPTEWSVSPGEVIKEIEEFATLTGLSETNRFIKAASFGAGTAALKVTFSGLG